MREQLAAQRARRRKVLALGLLVCAAVVLTLAIGWPFASSRGQEPTYSLARTRACLKAADFRVTVFKEAARGQGPLDWLYVDTQRKEGYVDLGFAKTPSAARTAGGDSEDYPARIGNVVLNGVGLQDSRVTGCLRE